MDFWKLAHCRWWKLKYQAGHFCGLLPIEMDFIGSERPPITIVMDDCAILDGLLADNENAAMTIILAKYLDQTAFKDINPITSRFDCNDQSNRLHSSNHAVNETNNKSNIWNCSSAPSSFFSVLAVTSTQNQQRTSNQRYNNAANHSSAITTDYPINYLGFYWKNCLIDGYLLSMTAAKGIWRRWKNNEYFCCSLAQKSKEPARERAPVISTDRLVPSVC